LDVNRGVVIVLDQLFADEDGVFKVVAAPGHEGHEHVTAEAEFAAIGAGSIGEHLGSLHAVAHANERLLVDASVLVGALELGQGVDVGTDFAAEYARVVAFDANDDAFGVDLIDDAVALAEDDCAGIAGGDALHAGADQRSFAADQRHSLALHVRTHQGAVRVVVFEEWNQTGGYRNKLLRGNVNVIHFITMLEDEVAGLTAVHEFGGDAQFFVEGNVSLSDDVLVFFPSGQVEAVGLVDNLAALQLFVEFFDAVGFDDIAGLEFAVAGIDDLDVIDVATFRRFNRADTAVVGRVNVADFESSAFTRQTTGPKSGETALVGNFAERVGLIHELAELRTAEEFADRGHNRLGVDQVVRHGCGHFLVHAHLFLDGAFHADQA